MKKRVLEAEPKGNPQNPSTNYSCCNQHKFETRHKDGPKLNKIN